MPELALKPKYEVCALESWTDFFRNDNNLYFLDFVELVFILFPPIHREDQEK